VQFDPEPRIAHRTSPTNIAMGLLASVSAHDLGFIDADVLVERLEATLTTIDRLEHFDGHLLNWYDTQNLMPLLPKYVSTVDSGNYAAALLTLSAALGELAASQADDDAGQGASGEDDRPRRSRQRLLRRNALRFSLRQKAAALRNRLPARRSISAARGSTRPSTICWPPKRGWRASSRSPRATCLSATGSTSAA
jgi:hypothetical protein